MPIDQFVVVDQRILDQLPDLKVQLKSLTRRLSARDDQYTYTPLPDYWDTFLWLLNTNQVPYQLRPASPS